MNGLTSPEAAGTTATAEPPTGARTRRARFVVRIQPPLPEVVRALPGRRPPMVPAPRHPADPSTPESGGPAPAGEPVPVPGLRGRAELVLRLTMEVVAGRRPAAQLNGLVSRNVLGYIAATSANRPVIGRRPAITPVGRTRRSIRTEPHRLGATAPRVLRLCQPTATAVEVSAVWRQDGRTRALAARFELRRRGGAEPKWLCTFLRLG
jgi:hypothetical protein